MLTQPTIINLTNPQGLPGANQLNVTNIEIPTGEGSGSYTATAVTQNPGNNGTSGSFNWTIGTTVINTTATNQAQNVTVSAGPFYYSIAPIGITGEVEVFADKPGVSFGAGNLSNPALSVVEHQDDRSVYNGWIVPTTQTGTYLTASSPIDTWDNSSTSQAITRVSNNYITDKTDRYGMIASTNTQGGSQNLITLSYPNAELADYLYMADTSAVVAFAAGGAMQGSSTQLGDILVTDAQVSSVSSKNLIVIGGSCINSIAANLVGSAACGPDFTTATGIGSGQFLIQSFASPYSTGAIALLVAGYEAADTVNAATYLTTQVVNTMVGNKYVGTSATSATLSTNQTTA